MTETTSAATSGGRNEQKDTEQFVTLTIGGQLFGVPVLSVQDVLAPQKITPIPLASEGVAGALNLRGRIVTAIDVRRRLNFPPRGKKDDCMYVVVELGDELYSLMIDSVGEVLSIPVDRFEAPPATLDERWREVCGGVYRLDEELLVVLDVANLITHQRVAA